MGKQMRFVTACLLIAIPAASVLPATAPTGPPVDRAEALLRQMTLEEKIDYIGGVTACSSGTSRG